MFTETCAPILLERPRPTAAVPYDDDCQMAEPVVSLCEAIREAIEYAEVAGWGFHGDDHPCSLAG